MSHCQVLFWRVIVLVVVLLPAMAAAVPVDHHEMIVESEGTVNDCLACHDGTKPNSAPICKSKCLTSKSHPVLTPYPAAGKRTKDFHSLSSVKQKGVKIVNGMVTCISCHNLKNQARNQLVMDNKGSKLCLSCHIR